MSHDVLVKNKSVSTCWTVRQFNGMFFTSLPVFIHYYFPHLLWLFYYAILYGQTDFPESSLSVSSSRCCTSSCDMSVEAMAAPPSSSFQNNCVAPTRYSKVKHFYLLMLILPWSYKFSIRSPTMFRKLCLLYLYWRCEVHCTVYPLTFGPCFVSSLSHWPMFF